MLWYFVPRIRTEDKDESPKMFSKLPEKSNEVLIYALKIAWEEYVVSQYLQYSVIGRYLHYSIVSA